MAERVVITGIGIVSPIGIGKSDFWHNLLKGKSGIRPISLFDASTYPSKLAGEVKDFDPLQFITPKQQRRFSRASQFALAAAKMALEDARLHEFDEYRTDVVMGTGTSAFDVIEEQIFKSPSAGREFEKGVVDPTGMVKAFVNAPACAIALQYQTQAYVTTVSTACASGINAIGNAYQRIREGDSEVAITGAVDTPINHLIYGAFCAAKFLTTEKNLDKAVCPFDKRRTKRALGEGAAVFILEELEHALARNAEIYAEITAFSQSSENVNELYMLDTTGERWSRHLNNVLSKRKSKVALGHINAHAPSDKFSDMAESRAIQLSLKEKAKSVPVMSIKGAVGQGFSVAGAFQVAATSMIIKHHDLPATYNYKQPDPECDLKINRAATHQKVESALVNAHGIGGINSSLVLERPKV